MTLIKLKEKEGDPQSVVNQLRALMMHFNRLVEDDGLVQRLWGHVRRNCSCTIINVFEHSYDKENLGISLELGSFLNIQHGGGGGGVRIVCVRC